MPYLTVCCGDEHTTHELSRPSLVLGSHADCDIVVKASGVSRRHARVFVEGADWVVEDLDSSAGTIVDGKAVRRHVLTHGVRFGLGQKAEAVFLTQPEPVQAGPVPILLPAGPRSAGGDSPLPVAELVSLLEIGAAINSSLAVSDVLESILDRALSLTGAERGFVMLLENGELVPKLEKNVAGDEELSFSRTFARKVIEKNRTIISTNVAEDPRYQSASILAHRIFSILATPLRAKEHIVGCLYVDIRRPSRFFSSEYVPFFDALANHAGLAIFNARMTEELRTSQQHLAAANVQLQKSLDETRLMYEISSGLSADLEVTTVLELLLSKLRMHLGATRTSVMLADESGRLVARMVNGGEIVAEDPVMLGPGEGVAGLAAAARRATLVNRVRHDPRFARLAARDDTIEHLMAAPLVSGNRCIGVVNVVSEDAGSAFTEDDLHLLESLSAVAGVAIEKHGVTHERIRQAKLNEQMELARKAQTLLIPRGVPRIPGLSFSTRYVPADRVGGDYFDFIPVGPDRLALVVADVSGHDIASSMIMAMGRTLIRTFVETEPSPAAALERVNRALAADMHAQWFITAFLAVVDLRTFEVAYVNAGNQPPLLLGAGTDRFEELSTGGLPLGLKDDARFDEGRFALGAGDRLLVFTDGLVEASSEHDRAELYGLDRVKEVVALHRAGSVETLVDAVHRATLEFVGGRGITDDLTLVGVSVEGRDGAGAAPAVTPR